MKTPSNSCGTREWKCFHWASALRSSDAISHPKLVRFRTRDKLGRFFTIAHQSIWTSYLMSDQFFLYFGLFLTKIWKVTSQSFPWHQNILVCSKDRSKTCETEPNSVTLNDTFRQKFTTSISHACTLRVRVWKVSQMINPLSTKKGKPCIKIWTFF